ncbi:hypothetical protein WJX84_009881 [Apatococcus fuscideae]|uniref:Sulfite exporter TauE/SafE n=1 Tax=Apatococcus fuscideae TaxID=2026836 RepID=A0AAW1T138_9CHLO
MSIAQTGRTLPFVACICVLYTLVGSLGYALQQPSAADSGLTVSKLGRMFGAPPEVQLRFQDDLWRNVSCLVLCIVVASISPASGVGGGSFFVAVFAAIMQWGVPAAVALSQATMCAAAFSGAVASGFSSHPDDPKKPIVDYDLALILSPGMLMGSSVGVLLNAVMPHWLTSFTLTFFLGYIAYNTAKKAAGLVKQETEQKEEQAGHDASASNAEPGDDIEEPLISKDKVVSCWCNYKGLLGIFVFWAVFMVLELNKRENDRCNARYAFLTASQVVVGTATLGLSIWQVSRKQSKSGSPGGASQRAWTISSYVKIAIFSLCGGVIAGLLGMGGGFIIAPLMLSLGSHPKIAAATSNTILFFSTSFAALAFERMGLLNYQFAAIFAGSCLVSGGLGVTAINWLIGKLGRPSVPVVLMASVAAISTILAGISKGGKSIQDLANGHNVGFKPFCP